MSEGAALALKPTGMSFDEAAAVCDGASQALGALRSADARAGSRIVIYGASGSLGTAAVQLAKHLGAHVTAVCGTDHVELVRSLGADEVVDYRQQDFTKNGETYDAIIDAVGKYSFRRGRRSLKPGGIYVATDGGRFFVETIGLLVATRWVGSKLVMRLQRPLSQGHDLRVGAPGLMEQGVEIFRLRHRQWAVEALGDPAGKPDVIGMRMRDDQPCDLLPGEWTGEHRLPGRLGLVGADAGVDHRPAALMGEHVDVDVVELERQREPQPLEPRREVDDLTRVRRRRPGEADGLGSSVHA